MAGWASRIWLDKVSGNWVFDAAIGAIHPQFETNDVGFLTRADFINAHVSAGYQWVQPDKIFRFKRVMGVAFTEYNFGGKKTREGYQLLLDGQFLNYWTAGFGAAYYGEAYDDQRTRGGPLMKSLRSQSANLFVSSDSRRSFYGSLSTSAGKGESGFWLWTTDVSFNWKATRTLRASLSLGYTRNHDVRQYVDAVADAYAPQTYGTRYIFGVLDQKQLSTTLRLNWTFTPKMSFQLYVQPLLSTGSYTGIKELAQPGTFSFNTYGEGASRITLSDKRYTIDPDGQVGAAPSFDIDNPDFNFKSLRANAVFRWEYMPGSTIYLVWTNEKMDYESRGDFDFSRDVSRLARIAPDNVYSIKITYWLNP
jgi:hypothetical protein